MEFEVSRGSHRVVLIVMFVLLALACRVPLESVRATTFPPDLDYIPPNEVRTSMWVLAAEVKHLEDLLAEPSAGDPNFKQAEVGRTLDRMRVALKSLDRPGRSSQHPALNEHLGQFVERLDRAERAAEREPPNYFPASTIAGSCFLCHGPVGTARSDDARPRLSAGR